MGRSSFIQLVLGLSAVSAVLIGFVANRAEADAQYSYELPPRVTDERSGELDPAGVEMTDVELTFVGSRALAGTARVAGRTCAGVVFGSGFLVDGLVFTNRHVAGEEGELVVEFGDERSPAPILAAASTMDAAVADGESFIGQPVALEWAGGAATVGQPVVLSGHARGGATKLVVGSVHLKVDGASYGVGGDVLLLEGVTDLGFSGGPVLDRNGDVIAMLQGFDVVTGLSLAIPGELLQSWLNLAGQSKGHALLSELEHVEGSIPTSSASCS